MGFTWSNAFDGVVVRRHQRQEAIIVVKINAELRIAVAATKSDPLVANLAIDVDAKIGEARLDRAARLVNFSK